MIGTQRGTGTTRPPAEVRPVPARPEDLVRAMRGGDLSFSKSRHRAPIGLHAHEMATVTILVEGRFEERYPGGGGNRVCVPSTVLYRPPGEPHADRFGRDGACNLVVEIPYHRLEPLVGQSDAWARLWEQRDATVHLIAHKMHRELEVADSATPLALEGLSLELLAHVTRAGPPGGDTAEASAPWVTRARELLREQFPTPTRVLDLALELDVHPVSLVRAFRARYGITPGAYLRQLRLTWAVSALAEGTKSLGEIAAE